MKPKISVITITYNNQDTISETIESVVTQDYDNFEYIIVDGGSSDRTVSIAQSFESKINKIISEPDNGISDAFNKGIRAASGDIIGICNSSDLLLPGVLSKVAEVYDESIDVYRCSEIVRNFDSGAEYVLEPSLVFPKVPFSFQVCHMGCFIRKDAFERFGYYDDRLKIAMDLDLLYRFNRLGAKMKKVEVKAGLFRLGGVSCVNSKLRIQEQILILQRNGGNAWDKIIFLCYLKMKEMIKNAINSKGNDMNMRLRTKIRPSK